MEGIYLSKRLTVRDSIMTVVDTVKLHNPQYDFSQLEQAAGQLEGGIAVPGGVRWPGGGRSAMGGCHGSSVPVT